MAGRTTPPLLASFSALLLLALAVPAQADDRHRGDDHGSRGVQICHKWGRSTSLMTVSSSAVSGHLRHGDSYPTTWYPDEDGDGYGSLGSSDDDDDDDDDDDCGGHRGHDDDDDDEEDDDGVVACSQPEGYADNTSDCDDEDASVHPGATETCNGLDDDCDGEVDESASGGGGVSTWYADADGDGFGDPNTGVAACSAPEGEGSEWVADASDCDDGDAAVSPDALEICDAMNTDEDCNGFADDADSAPLGTSIWYTDADEDSYGDGAAPVLACDQPSGAVSDTSDCDDADAAINPDSDEVCDTLDNDCDGLADEPDALDAGTWYTDNDGDGFGDAASSTVACEAPGGTVANATDCDDNTYGVNPDAAELCDAGNTDEDCDGLADDADSAPLGMEAFYSDGDGDGYGDPYASTLACDQPLDTVVDTSDCDDADAAINPDSDEVCDTLDNDCDGLADEPDALDAGTWYTDNDGDGFGDAGSSTVACEAPAGTVADATDCDDDAYGVNPDAAELCDAGNTDEDCNSLADDADTAPLGTEVFYRDADNDGFGDLSAPTLTCDQPTGTVTDSADCDDNTSAAWPGATETCDSLDNDCDGQTDESGAVGESTWYADADLDGYGDPDVATTGCDEPSDSVDVAGDCDDGDPDVFTGANELCDGVDNDCDETVDYTLDGLWFDAQADTVTIADSDDLNLGTAFTLEAWVWYDNFPGFIYNKFVSGKEDHQLGIDCATSAPCAYGSAIVPPSKNVRVSSTSLMTSHEWTHVALVYDGSALSVYEDGELMSSAAATGDVLDSTGQAHIGGITRGSTKVHPMHGFIRDVRISSTARYTTDFVPDTDLSADSATQALWKLDEGTGSSASDSSGHGLTGTISGASWVEVACIPE